MKPAATSEDKPLDSFVFVSAQDERDQVIEILSQLGASAQESFVQADILTEADLHGHHSHGVQRLPVIARRIQKKLIRVDVTPDYAWTADSVLSVDGKDGLGPFIADSALTHAHSALKARGIIAVATRNTSHLGMVGYYCEKQARQGFICLAMTTSEALVHPYGGVERLVGTNPLAIGIPAHPEPFVFDMATSTGAMGKILASKHRGESIPPGWAVDAEGNSTTNPDEALKGALTPAAGAKGYGLGVAIGILAGLLPGGDVGRAVMGTLDTEYRCNKADLFLLLDPGAFVGGPLLAARVTEYLNDIRSSRPQRGAESVTVPGERSHGLREERMRTGIPLPKEVWGSIERLKDEL